MKKINYYFFCLLFSVAVMAGCKKDDGGGPSPEATALAKLQGVWDINTAAKDGVALNGYEDMKLTISDKTMSASGTPDKLIFPEGNFTFSGTDFKNILVNTNNRGAINVEILASTETALTLRFDLEEDGTDASSRVAVVQGQYTFSFKK